jgi:hypothetical protein
MHWVHRMNIERYRKILRTYLTAEERRFVECRLAEEQAALQQPAGGVSTVAIISTKPSFAGICRDGKEKS